MVNWKLYIDSPQKRALDLSGGSLTKGNGAGYGVASESYDAGGNGYGCGYGWDDGGGNGNGWLHGYGWDDGGGNGESSTEW